jgi:hypothetical protein
MTHKDFKITIMFEDEMRPTVHMSITFDDAEDMGTFLNKLKEFWENQVKDKKTKE